MKTIRQGFRAALLMAAAVAVLAFGSGARAQDRDDDHDSHHNDNIWPYAMAHKSPVLAVVGDVSCQPGVEVPGETAGVEVCTDPANSLVPAGFTTAYTSTTLWQSQEATADQIENVIKPDAVALLGDLQYQVGRYSDFEHSFDWTYGAFKFLHRPAPGNHEVYNEHGEIGVSGYGYFSYYNGFETDTAGNPIMSNPIPDPCPSNRNSASCKKAGTGALLSTQPVPRADGQAGHFELGANGVPGQNGMGVGDGWYSYNLGSWHLISLNIECFPQAPIPGDGCSSTSPWFKSELDWLKKDLDENHSACTAAYWHQPLFSAADSLSEEGTASQAFWQLLYQHHADLVLNGHDHLYARYRPLDPLGNPEPRRGIREFIVGTGGETLDPVAASSTGDAGSQFNFNNLEAPTGGSIAQGGQYWGVLALTLDDHGYKWDFEPALELPGAPPASFSDTGSATCHGSPDWDRDDHDR